MMNFFGEKRAIIKYVLRNFSLSFFVIIFMLVNTASAQFGEDVRVSDTTGGFFGCIEPWIVNDPNDVLSVVWSSDYTGAFDIHIYFSKSIDMGNTWMPSVRIDDVGEACLYPCLAVDSFGNLYCVWQDMILFECQIYFSKSTDGGSSWIPSIRVDDAPSGTDCVCPEIIVNGDDLLIVWTDTRVDERNYFSKSTDGGMTWSSSVEISGMSSKVPILEAYGDTIFCSYYKGYSDSDIYLSRSTDDGSTWQVMGRINDISSGRQFHSDIALTPNGILTCAWYDWRSGDCEIRFSKSTDGGGSWIPSVVVSDTSWYQNPGIGEIRMNVACLDENCIYCLWQDFRYGSWDIFFAISEDSGANWSENVLVNDSAASGLAQMVPSLCLDSDGNPCTVWGDERSGEFHIYFDKGEFSGIEANATYSFIEDSNILQSYPNPFKKLTTIKFQVPTLNQVQGKSQVTMSIYDATGRLVKDFSRLTLDALHPTQISWDGTDNSGKKVPAGVYFAQLIVNEHSFTKEVILLR
ncbi:exo-alpha-sialidase [candidate division WOR-3 bacterium]|nr:exo-alpha-sialidase [candidate division WOR-3 bacterium]